MKQVVNNLRDGNRVRLTVLLAPLVFLPLGLMGVTTPTLLRHQAAIHTEKAAREGHEYALGRQADWQAIGAVDERLAELKAVNARLASLIPDWQEELMVHGAIRDSALEVGLSLSRLQLMDPVRLGPALDGKVVVERVISLSGLGSGNCVHELVDQLRRQGWPTCVHALDANLDLSQNDLYSYEIRLGVFHYAPAQDFLEVEVDEAISQIEEPIQ